MGVKLHRELEVDGALEEVINEASGFPWVHPLLIDVLRAFIRVRGKYLGAIGNDKYEFGTVSISEGKVRPEGFEVTFFTPLDDDAEVCCLCLHAALFAKMAKANDDCTKYSVSYRGSELNITAEHESRG